MWLHSLKYFLWHWVHLYVLLKSDLNAFKDLTQRLVQWTMNSNLSWTTKCDLITIFCLWFWSHSVMLLKSDLDFQWTGFGDQFFKCLSQTWVAQESVNIFIATIVTNLVTPKATAKDELLINKTTSSSVHIEVTLKKGNKV